jgi:hypothetical protein
MRRLPKDTDFLFLFAAVCWGEALDPMLIELPGVISRDVNHRQIADHGGVQG